MKKRYIVFERVQGGTCFTIAMKSTAQHDPAAQDIPAEFMFPENAADWVRTVHSMRRGWWAGKPYQRPMEAHIATVELPE